MTGSDVIFAILANEDLKAGTFARMIGVTTTQIYDLQNGKVKKISDKVSEKILNVFPQYNKSWLLTGEGSMLKESLNNEKKIEIQAMPMNHIQMVAVPLVNQYAYAGYLNGYQNETYMSTLPTISYPVDSEANGNYIAFEVKGDSMDDGTSDSYLEGDRLICKELPSYLWAQTKMHIKKWDFVIVHNEGILVKRIVDHNVDTHTITVHSLNEFYPDRNINLEEVKQIFYVIDMSRSKRR